MRRLFTASILSWMLLVNPGIHFPAYHLSSAVVYAVGGPCRIARIDDFSLVAQETPLLVIQPSDTWVPVGNELTIDLVVMGGIDVNAFDVTLTYNPDILSLKAWAPGDYLSNLSVVNQDNQPGSLSVAATQLATAPVSGEGILLTLDFIAEAAGVSALTIAEAEFAGPMGAKTAPGRIDGTVTAVEVATFTPTVTLTPTPMLTRTPTATRTVTIASTVVSTAVSATTQTTPNPTTRPFFTSTRTIAPTSLPGATATRSTLATQPGALITSTGATVTDLPPGVGEAYPAETQALTLTGSGATEAVDVSIEGSVTETIINDAESTQEAAVAVNESPHAPNWLATLLWVVLIAGGVIILVMLGVILRHKARQRHTKEDLLL